MSRKKKALLGYAKFGSASKPAVRYAFAGGTVLSLIFGVVVAAVRSDYVPWWENFLIFAICMFPVFTALVWAVCVDRSTLPRAVQNPDSSIESIWVDKAAANSFWSLIGGGGLLTAVLVIFSETEVTNILFWVLLAAMSMFVGFYLWEQHKG